MKERGVADLVADMSKNGLSGGSARHISECLEAHAG